MDWLDRKYVSLASVRLERFKWVQKNVANCRCFVCGDSQSDKRKARGYFFSKKEKTAFMCHNCGAAMSLSKALYELDPSLADQYKLEKFGRPSQPKQEMVDPATLRVGTTEIMLPLVKFLSESHEARQYCLSRKIPLQSEIYHCKEFAKWGSSTFEQLAKWNKAEEHSRLVLPIYDKDRTLVGMSARAYDNRAPKYCNVNLFDQPMIFGIDKIDHNKQIFVCEGPIDSLMLSNAVAVMNGCLSRADPVVNKQAIYIPDHQPRNTEIVKLTKKLVEQGKRVVLWPDSWMYKDLNEAVCDGFEREQLEKFIVDNSFQGLRALTEFSRWKKV